MKTQPEPVDDLKTPVISPSGIAPEIVRLNTAAWQLQGSIYRREKEFKCVTKYWDLYVRLYRATAYAYKSGDGQLVSFLAIAYNKTPKGDWGKYINSYLVYTQPNFRKQGYATFLHRAVEQDALKKGYARTQSLIKTYAGFRFHLALGHTFWGLNERGEMRCDSPLLRNAPNQPRGVAAAAQDVFLGHPLNTAELIDILVASPLYRQTRKDAEALFQTHTLGYDPDAYRPIETLC